MNGPAEHMYQHRSLSGPARKWSTPTSPKTIIGRTFPEVTHELTAQEPSHRADIDLNAPADATHPVSFETALAAYRGTSTPFQLPTPEPWQAEIEEIHATLKTKEEHHQQNKAAATAPLADRLAPIYLPTSDSQEAEVESTEAAIIDENIGEGAGIRYKWYAAAEGTPLSKRWRFKQGRYVEVVTHGQQVAIDQVDKLKVTVMHKKRQVLWTYEALTPIDWNNKAQLKKLNQWSNQVHNRHGECIRETKGTYCAEERDWFAKQVRENPFFVSSELVNEFNKTFGGKVLPGHDAPRPSRSDNSVGSEVTRSLKSHPLISEAWQEGLREWIRQGKTRPKQRQGAPRKLPEWAEKAFKEMGDGKRKREEDRESEERDSKRACQEGSELC